MVRKVGAGYAMKADAAILAKETYETQTKTMLRETAKLLNNQVNEKLL